MTKFSPKLVCLAICMIVPGACSVSQPDHDVDQFDVVITGGTVFDGDGSNLGELDIAIADGVIAELGVGLAGTYSASQIIDASGSIVAPGFIDPHTHGEDDLATGDSDLQANLAYAFQGVTTVMVGNDGFGFEAIREVEKPYAAGTNYVFLSGLGDIRQTVIGPEDRPATAGEIVEMSGLVQRDMCAGAFGLSASLKYPPQSFSSTDEVIQLAKVAARFGGYYDTHLRDESDHPVGVLNALDEAIEIAREAELPLHVSHIKALGPAVWGKSADMVAWIEAARSAGVRITADQYPWLASGTRVSRALVPTWALDGGLDGLRERLSNQAVRAEIVDAIADNIARRGGADRLLITASLHGADVDAGLTLAQISEELGVVPEQAAVAILLDGDARLASFNMSQDDLDHFAAQPWVVTGSDGSTGHPRKYGSFPKAYVDWVRDGEKEIGWFIGRSSGFTADIIGLQNRGYLRPGMFADIVIFDPSAFAPVATYQDPTALSQGVQWLLVNGELVIDRGEYSETMPGRLIRKEAPQHLCAD